VGFFCSIMNYKKVFKITGIVLGAIILGFGLYVAYIYYNHKNAFDTTGKPYKNYIGYINPDTALLNSTYTLCNEGYIERTYNGAGLDAYYINKKEFRDQLALNYNGSEFTDSGYLNFRFLVNCEGNAGWFEIIELNLDLEETTLNPKMVANLLKFTSDSKHWNALKYTKEDLTYNYYMYVSYRIENGKITEIIP